MAGAIIWFLALLIIGATQASPLPKGQSLVISTVKPDTGRVNMHPLDRMMGDAPSRVARNEPKIDVLQIHSEIKYRFAQTLVTSIIRNPAGFTQELSFSVVLPEEAFITGFVMETRNQSYRAFLAAKSEADAAYSHAVQSEAAGATVSFRDSNLFDIKINIEGMQQVRFRLAYEQLLQREKDFYRHVVTVSPGQVVPGMKVKVHILESRNITKIIVPTFAINNMNNTACSGANTDSICISDGDMVNTTKFSDREYLLVFGPTKDKQTRLSHKTGRLLGQFEVLYDVKRDVPGGEILVHDGYFIHTFAPPAGQAYLPKHIIFVLDVSSSMERQKITQVKDAMKTILPDLRLEDRFNIISFAHYVNALGFGGEKDIKGASVQTAFPATPQNIEEAKNKTDQMTANGGTDIFLALSLAVRTAKTEQSVRPGATKPIVFFLTDGEPTNGIKSESDIISHLAQINSSPKIPIYCFAFGEGAHYEFLKKLCLDNSGNAQRIYKDLDANVQLKEVYTKISNAVLSNVTFKYLPEEVDLSSVTQLNYHTFFEGTELIVSGRTIDPNAKSIKAEIISTGRNNADKTVQVQSVEPTDPQYKVNASWMSLADPNVPHKAGFMERAWAYLTIKQLIDKSKTASSGSSNENRAIELAKKYNFASEFTSFVIVKPDGGKQVGDAKRIIVADSLLPPFTGTTEEPATDKPEDTIIWQDFKTFHQVSSLRLPEFKLYNKASLQDVKWITDEERTKGYIVRMNSNGTFTSYAILQDIDQLDPRDEPNCIVDKLVGKCRHLSQCAVLEVLDDYQKFRKYYQCELEDYLAICCPY